MVNNTKSNSRIHQHSPLSISANRKAMELFNMDLAGRNIAPILKDFHMNVVKDSMILEQNGVLYRLTISNSLSKTFSYLVYQFFQAVKPA